MLKSLSTSLILRGVLATVVGILALAWPGVTVFALVILFAVYAFVAGGLQTLRAFSSDTAGPVFGHLLLGLVSLAAGVIALAWPLPTALVLVLIVGTWAVISGLVEIFSAFRGRRVRRNSGHVPARRPGLDRVRPGAARPSRHGCGHPRGGLWSVQPDIRSLDVGARHRVASDRQELAFHLQARIGGLIDGTVTL